MAYTCGLSSSEKKAVEELQTRLKNDLSSETFEDSTLLYRFLKARNFNVEKAECMLRKHLIWRKSFQVDDILKDFKPKEYFRKYFEPTLIGYDKDGDIVLYVPAGKFEGRDIMKCTKVNDYLKHWIWFTESLFALRKELKEKTGRECPRITLIIDLDQLTLRNVTSKSTMEISSRRTHLMADNYPEILKSGYIINAPSYFVIFYSILKPVMSREMIQKIRVFGLDGWKGELLEAVDADVLPAFLGGNRTDPDGNPLCTTFVNHGGKISKIYYLLDKERCFKDISQVKTLLVPQSGKKEVYVDVTECGSLIQWEFLARSKDIGFGLFFQVFDKEDLKAVLPVQKYDTADGTEVGHYRAQSAGIYVIIFDNSYSWISSKEVEYCITVLKPGFRSIY